MHDDHDSAGLEAPRGSARPESADPPVSPERLRQACQPGIASITYYALAAAAALALAVVIKLQSVSATCQGKAMQPGDTCTEFSRGRNAGTRSYEEVLQVARQQHITVPIGLLAAAVALLALVALTVIAIRRSTPSTSPPPASGHATRHVSPLETSFSAGLLGSLGVGGVVIGLWMLILLDGSVGSVVAIVVGALVSALILLARPEAAQVLRLDDQGVDLHDQSGWRRVVWDRILLVRRSSTDGADGLFVLRDVDGVDLELSDFSEGSEITARFDADARTRRVPALLERVRSGETIDFGAASVSSQAIRLTEGATLPWDQVAAVTVRGPNLILRTTDGVDHSVLAALSLDWVALVGVAEALSADT